MNQGSRRVGVAVVTYLPTHGWQMRLTSMATHGSVLVVVDNGSGPETQTLLKEVCRERGWELIAYPENLGLAAALNHAVQTLAERGYEWALLFDQDSEPAGEMGAELLATAERCSTWGQVAVVGSNFRDAVTGEFHRFLRPHRRCRWWFEKTALRGSDMPVTMVITSGALVRIEAFRAVGGFDAAFFIDHVDTDFCLRSREVGWLVVASSKARMGHALGHRTVEQWWGWAIRPTHHSPTRHYYIARNRVTMIGRHAVRSPHWVWFELAAAALWIFRVLVAEPQKTAKLSAILWGTWDGLRGGHGKIPPDRERRLR